MHAGSSGGWKSFPLPGVLLAVAIAACGDVGQGEWQGVEMVALEGATVFTSPHVSPIENGVVLIVDGVIEAVGRRDQVPVPAAALRIEAQGLSVMAGFWNTHVRVDEELLQAAATGSAEEVEFLIQDRFTRFGFTTLVETSTPRDRLVVLIERIQSGEVMGPRILSTGGAQVAGIHWPDASAMLAGSGSIDVPGGTGTVLVPALGLVREVALAGSATAAIGPMEQLAEVADGIRGFVSAGGSLMFGSGAGYVDQYDPTTDLLVLEEAGIPFSTRLASLTTVPAERFDYFSLGVVEPGMVADLVLVDGDPEVDVNAFGRVRIVLREGRPLFVR
jgi:imidazolonepropionase-like amidohydrolase